MIHFGPIRRLWSGPRLLLWAWVHDDGSRLKAQCATRLPDGTVVIGKGYDLATSSYPRLCVRGWQLRRPVPVVVIGIGRWRVIDWEEEAK